MSGQEFNRTNAEKIAKEWFEKVDALDPDGTMSLCNKETVVTFGNQPSVKGEVDLRNMFSGWYRHFDKMQHNIRNISIDNELNTVFIESRVGYHLKANKEISPIVVPVMSVMRFGASSWTEQPKFVDFRIYIDTSPVTTIL